MKTLIQMLIMTGIVSLAAVNSANAADQPATVVATTEPVASASQSLEAGVIEEEANLNPEAALAAYHAVIQRFEAQRLEAAQAMFRSAEVLRKTGHRADAKRTYERIVREFADQRELVSKSQRQLASLRSPIGAGGSRPGMSRGNTDKYPWLMNVAFGSSLNKRGLAAVGNGASDYWNGYYLPWIDVVPLVNLMLWNGSITPVGMEIRNAAGTWSNQTGDPMYDAYVYVNDGSDKHILLTLTNLPPGHYDFYLYGHADPGGQGEGNSQFQISSGEKTTGWLGTVKSAGWRATQPWSEGKQFVRIRNVEVTLDEPVVVRVRAGFDGQPVDPNNRPPVINGMQIMRLNQDEEEDVPTDKATPNETAEAGAILTPEVGPTPSMEIQRQADVSLRDALQQSKNTLLTLQLTDLQKQLTKAQEQCLELNSQYQEARRLYQQVEKFKDRPELLPKPAANDPRYQQLKRAYDQVQLDSLGQPKGGQDTTNEALQTMQRFIQGIYEPELKVALEESISSLEAHENLRNHLEQRLAKEQDRLTNELKEERR